MVKLKHKHESVILTLQPNRSANWQQNKIIMMVMAAFVMIIAIVWSVAGAWLILPFAGFEVGLLAFLMYRVSYSTYQKQIIIIDKDTLTFAAGVYYQKSHFTFNKHKLIVRTTEPKTDYEQTLITLEDELQKVVVGEFLNQQERQTTLAHFRKAHLYVHNDRWWKNSS
jgi:uncharacterized membrane protein